MPVSLFKPFNLWLLSLNDLLFPYSPHVPASPHMVSSPHISHEHFAHHVVASHLNHHDQDQQQQQLHDLHLSNRHPLLHAHHSQPHPMVLLVHQQQQQQQQQHQLHH
jgi:hypothetical protein